MYILGIVELDVSAIYKLEAFRKAVYTVKTSNHVSAQYTGLSLGNHADYTFGSCRSIRDPEIVT